MLRLFLMRTTVSYLCFLNRDWLPDEERRDKRWLTPTLEDCQRIYSPPDAVSGDDLHSRNMTLNGSGSTGLSNSRLSGRQLGGYLESSQNVAASQTLV